MTDVLPCFRPLLGLRWRLMELRLRNLRSAGARQHPLAILHGVLKSALVLQGDEDIVHFFHPVEGPFGGGMRAGREYRLEVVFPHADEAGVERFVHAVERHLEDPRNNFVLVESGRPRLQGLSELLADSPPDHGTDEVCLDFRTPFPFIPRIKPRRWLIDAEDFFRAMTNRIRRLYGLEVEATEEALQGLELLHYFWSYREYHRRSRSNDGVQYLNGASGRLLLRGPAWRVWPLLLACSVLHVGRRLGYGLGHYRLLTNAACLDGRLEDVNVGLKALERLARWSGEPVTQASREASDRLLRQASALGAAATGLSTGPRQAPPEFDPGLGVRALLAELLAEPARRSLEMEFPGLGRLRSREEDASARADACREGYAQAVEVDLSSSAAPGAGAALAERLGHILPRADRLVRGLATFCLQREIPSEKDPLASVAADLRLGWICRILAGEDVRLAAGPDFLLLFARSAEQAARALAMLRPSGKAALHDVDARLTDGCDPEEEDTGPALRKPLFVRGFGVSLGLDHDALVVRREDDGVTRIPVGRVSQMAVLGEGSISARLLRRCAEEGIPVSLCHPSGRHAAMLRPESARWFESIAMHAQRRQAMDERELLAVARMLVEAKLSNYAAWFRSRREPGLKTGVLEIERHVDALSGASSTDAVRGHEGEAAKGIFRLVNGLVRDEDFRSEARIPGRKPDRWNALLDLCHSLLFSRLNILVRNRGLSPYLGFLHSPRDEYESLVCDLQEPFRCRMERLAVKLVNLKTVTAEDFKRQADCFSLTGGAFERVLERFEHEQAIRLAEDPHPLGRLLAFQVRVVSNWAEQGGELRFYRSGEAVPRPDAEEDEPR